MRRRLLNPSGRAETALDKIFKGQFLSQCMVSTRDVVELWVHSGKSLSPSQVYDAVTNAYSAIVSPSNFQLSGPYSEKSLGLPTVTELYFQNISPQRFAGERSFAEAHHVLERNQGIFSRRQMKDRLT